MKKITALLVITVIVFCMCSCSDMESAEVTNAIINIIYDADAILNSNTIMLPYENEKAADTDNGNNQKKDPVTGSVTICVSRDDRSVAMTEFGKENGKFKFYYETALLPENVNNYEKINTDIIAKKEMFFSSHGGRDKAELEKILSSTFTNNPFCYASVKSIYLDENYYSVNMEIYSWYGGTDMASFAGYTYDLDTGEEVGLEKVFGMEKQELSILLHDKVRPYMSGDSYSESNYPDSDSFFDNEYYGSFNFCIAQDGRVYILYEKYQVAGGYRGCIALYLDKYNEENRCVYYSEMRDLEGGCWDSLTPSQIDDVAQFMKLEKQDYDCVFERVPYCIDGEWCIPVVFGRYDGKVLDEVIFASAIVKTDDPRKIRKTSNSINEDVYGDWYLLSSDPEENEGENVPVSCYVFDESLIEIYDYDRLERRYKKSGSKDIHSIKCTITGYVVEAENDDGTEKVTYKTGMWDSCIMDRFDAWISETPYNEFYESYSGSERLIRSSSPEFKLLVSDDFVMRDKYVTD